MLAVDLQPEMYQPRPPEKKDYGIGIIGCGDIVRHAHLPAYRKFGYRVVGACDISPEALRRVREDFGVPFVTSNADELLVRPDVDVIDLAVHAGQRLPLIEKIARAGKPVLSQKPFAMTLADAERMVRICEEAGVPLMINQQARWAPAHRAIRVLLDQGVLGHLYSVLHVNRGNQDHPGTWFTALENANIVDHGIHYLDLSRYFTGRTPLTVKATTAMAPGQAAVSPMIYTITCEYEPDAGLMATLHFNNIVQAPALHRYEWFLDGTEGSIVAGQSELAVSLKSNPRHKQVFAIQGSWFPDAFGGSMGELMQALHEGREPRTAGRDNLDSIRIAVAAVESARSGQAVRLS